MGPAAASWAIGCVGVRSEGRGIGGDFCNQCCTVVTNFGAGDCAKTLLVRTIEIHFHIVNGVFSKGTTTPIANGIGEKTCIFKVLDGVADCSGFRDGVLSSSKIATCTNLSPSVLKWLEASPLVLNVV